MPTSTVTNAGLRKRPGRRGFTLVELMAATLIGALILIGILTTNLQLMRNGVRLTHYAEMNSQVRRSLEQFASDARSASAIKWNGASDVTLTLPTLSGGTRQVTYAWTAATQAFFMVPGADSSVTSSRVYLLRGIPAFSDGSPGAAFARYDRTGTTTSTDAATKSIQVVLNVQRTASTVANSGDTTVSAVFILRNKPVS